MLAADFVYFPLQFRRPAGTSRGILNSKESWFLTVWNIGNPGVIGVGECSLIPGLSPDPQHLVEKELVALTQNFDQADEWLHSRGSVFPALAFALETALADLENGGRRKLFDNAFVDGLAGISINGLVWMGDPSFMKSQIIEKIDAGFDTIKIKVGALQFHEELSLLAYLRKEFDHRSISLRLDANGAFSAANAIEKLKQLSDFNIHSIEQPIKAGQPELMAWLCEKSPIAIALDEELIGIAASDDRKNLLQSIRPHYIILKPSLLGGLNASNAWIQLAEELKIGWWATSALESNIGLNAISQWAASHKPKVPQGLGTGQLYLNNLPSPLEIKNAALWYNHKISWNLKDIGL